MPNIERIPSMNNIEQNQKAAIDSETATTPSFDDFSLSKEVKESIDKLGFKVPTPVQIETYKEISAGNDIIAMAQTGTGKTAAFGIPIAERVDPKRKDVQALILTPTRELALQVSRELTAIGEKRGVNSAAVYGGASFSKQVSEVKNGAQVVTGTPGRVLDHIRRRTISFAELQILVLDEADEMLSMGFEKEISEIIESLPKQRQSLLFSATIPDHIKRLTTRYMDDASIISVSGDHIGAKEVSHYVYLVSGKGRPRDMVRVIEAERPSSAIIFCNTRDETQIVAKYLKSRGYNADWLNSDLSQSDREKVMASTLSGKTQFLVATDVAARGIDVSHLSHVMNYSFPESLDIYIHRTGRTGRMGRRGAAVSLITPQDIGNLYYLRLTYKIFPVEKFLSEDDKSVENIELYRLEDLRREYSKKINGEFLSLSRRLMQDVHAERIISSLLANYFSEGTVKNQPGTAAAKHPSPPKKKDTRPPKNASSPPEAKEKKASLAHSGPSKQAASEPPPAAQVSSEDQTPRSKPDDEPKPKPNEIYIDAGRKDGLRITMLMREISRFTDLPRSAIGKVRMLARSTFVSVPEEHFNMVQKAIGKIEFQGRKLKAEPAKQP